jgi:hypothetical protein
MAAPRVLATVTTVDFEPQVTTDRELICGQNPRTIKSAQHALPPSIKRRR